MRLSRYLESWHGTTATNKLLAVAVVAVATVTIVQSAYLMERERLVVLVPPVLQGEAVIGKQCCRCALPHRLGASPGADAGQRLAGQCRVPARPGSSRCSIRRSSPR